MPSVSTPTRRPLAALDANVNSPLHRQKNSPHVRSKLASSPRGAPAASGESSLPLTPSSTPRFALARSTSQLVPSNARSGASAKKYESFSEYKSTRGRNVKADLAATKLKLRLQLAFYKLRSQKDALTVKMSPKITVSPTSLSDSHQQTFKASVNVNLQKPRVSSGPLLTTVASRKVNTKHENVNLPDVDATRAQDSSNVSSMRLYHIKPLSAYHNHHPQRLPLTSGSSQRLPPVHKILKTPIKSTTRNLIHQYHASKNETRYTTSNPNAHSASANSATSSAAAACVGDDTIDETVDETAASFTRSTNDDVLGSSPLRCDTFSTPNSFSVAKSLLQLGLGFY